MKLPTATVSQVIGMNPCWLYDEKNGAFKIRALFRKHGKTEVNALDVLALRDRDISFNDAVWLACHLLPAGLVITSHSHRVPYNGSGLYVADWAWNEERVKLLIRALKRRQRRGR